MAYNKVSPFKTKIMAWGDSAVIKYHNTIIVNAGKDTVILYTGGYSTVTTKRKMNQASHQFGLNYTVFQKNYDWFVVTKAGTFAFTTNYFVFDRETGLPLTGERKVA
jgi:hypothetical protein